MSMKNKKYRDVFSEINAGFPPAIVAAGSSAGSAINMTGIGKLVFHVDQGSGGAAMTRLLLYGASASTGTGSVSLGQTPIMYASATSASGGTAVIEVRGEFVENNSTGPWVIPVLSVSGASAVVAVHANGYLTSYQPALYNDAPAAYVQSETLLY
jgi:hypothetical protein